MSLMEAIKMLGDASRVEIFIFAWLLDLFFLAVVLTENSGSNLGQKTRSGPGQMTCV